MKNKLLAGLILLASFANAQSQVDTDSSHIGKKYKSGFGVYAEVGILSNNSFKGIREKMQAMNIKPFEPLMASIILAKRMETERFYMENRLILMNSTNNHKDKNVSKSMFRGIGIGVDASPKIVNSARWNVLIPIGWDLMLYQTQIKNNKSATLGQVAQNPNAYKSMKLYNGSWNLHGGVGVDYLMNWFPKSYDQVYLSAKAAYHLPILKRGKWRGEDVQITDLPSFKANQLYTSIGLIFFPKGSHKMWRGMH